jgi:hypothetical protein
VLRARPFGALIPLDLRRPDPPNPSPSPLVHPLHLLGFSCYLPLRGRCRGSLVSAFYVSLLVCVPFCFVLRGWVRLLLETLDISVSHSCACVCIVMAIACACVGSILYVRVAGVVLLKDSSCANSARVRAWKLFVLLTTMGMIWTWSHLLLCLMMACLRGSYMLCMLLMVPSVLQSVEYLHSMSGTWLQFASDRGFGGNSRLAEETIRSSPTSSRWALETPVTRARMGAGIRLNGERCGGCGTFGEEIVHRPPQLGF